MKKMSITQRWVTNSFGIVLVLFVLIEIVFTFSMKNYYYSSTKQYLFSRMRSISSTLVKSSQSNSLNYSSEIRNIIENFDEKEKAEIMALDIKGDIIVTSSGFPVNYDINKQDFLQAQQLSSGYAYNVFKLESGEKVMSICMTIPPVATTQFSGIRMITSLESVDNQLQYLVVIMTLILAVIMIIVSLSGLYFVKSIVNPVREIGNKARRFSTGNFTERIQKKRNDELGELCDIINTMADDLSNADAMKNEFISSVSHELRTPLTAIKGWSETLKEIDDPETIKKGMHVITNETERLSQMVEELLDFSRIQNGRFTLTKETMDILAELGEAVLIYQVRAVRENKRIEYNEPEMLSFVYGDKNRLRQAFINIIDNAIKYSDEGDVVLVEISEENDLIEIVIKDTGCGIKKTDLPKIKTKFYKANHTRRGSGIGLAVTDEIISMHGGSLEIKSEENVGTTVKISLPTIPKKTPVLENYQQSEDDMSQERNTENEQ